MFYCFLFDFIAEREKIEKGESKKEGKGGGHWLELVPYLLLSGRLLLW